jgi:hypothetical protein
VDQNNVPFMIVGDSTQSLFVSISEADAKIYFAARQAEGFNTVWVNLLCNSSNNGPNSDGSTYDEIPPFLANNDLSQPNPAYFQRVDDMINLAAQYDITVILDPAETIGWLGTLRNNGATVDFNYGVYVGNRYKNFPNIIWMFGNDFQTWTTASDDAVVLAVAKGIQSVDSNHLCTIELNYFDSNSLDDSNWTAIVSLNASYTYSPTYLEVLRAYYQSIKPTFLVESNYQGFSVGRDGVAAAEVLRRQEYWTITCGASGQLYGDINYDFPSGWQSNMNTTTVVELGYMRSFFSALPWYNLVPDQSHAFVTAGYGTPGVLGDSVMSSNYVTAAATPDGTVAVVFMPQVTTITLNMSKFSGPVTARWFDPSNGGYTPVTGSPFPNSGSQQFMPPGNTSDGHGDWVLVLTTSIVPSSRPAVPRDLRIVH